jgi:hypothetical protein
MIKEALRESTDFEVFKHRLGEACATHNKDRGAGALWAAPALGQMSTAGNASPASRAEAQKQRPREETWWSEIRLAAESKNAAGRSGSAGPDSACFVKAC